MSYDNSKEGVVRDYLAGAERALTRGDATSASREIVEALRHCFSIIHNWSDTDPARYRQAWEEIARELAKLPPSLVRHAVRIIDGCG